MEMEAVPGKWSLSHWQDIQTIVCIIGNKTNTKGSSFSTELVYFCIQMRTYGAQCGHHTYSRLWGTGKAFKKRKTLTKLQDWKSKNI